MSEATSGTFILPLNPAYRCAHAGYLLPAYTRQTGAERPKGYRADCKSAVQRRSRGGLRLRLQPALRAAPFNSIAARQDKKNVAANVPRFNFIVNPASVSFMQA